MNREDLKKLQFERLRKTIEAAGNSPFYSKVFKENGITADSIQSLDDLQKIPFTTKDDLRNNYPYGMAALFFRVRLSTDTNGVQFGVATRIEAHFIHHFRQASSIAGKIM